VIDMCEYNGGSESAQHTAPDRQAAFQNIQRANGFNRTFIRLMIDHMEEPRANQAGNDNSQNAVRNFLVLKPFHPDSLSANQTPGITAAVTIRPY